LILSNEVRVVKRLFAITPAVGAKTAYRLAGCCLSPKKWPSESAGDRFIVEIIK
jgi:hypothetical protein